MDKIIETLLKDPYFIYAGAFAAIIISISIFKKLLKLIFYVVIIILIFAIYVIKSEKDPSDIFEGTAKIIEQAAEKKEDFEKKAKNIMNDVDKHIPSKIKKSLKNKLSDKKLKKVEKNLLKKKSQLK